MTLLLARLADGGQGPSGWWQSAVPSAYSPQPPQLQHNLAFSNTTVYPWARRHNGLRQLYLISLCRRCHWLAQHQTQPEMHVKRGSLSVLLAHTCTAIRGSHPDRALVSSAH